MWLVAHALVAFVVDHLQLACCRFAVNKQLASHTPHICNPSNTRNHDQLARRLRALLRHTNYQASMSPTRKHASVSSDEDIPTFPAPPTLKETAQTPLRSPAGGETMEGNRTAGITQVQKQALIDNIQLECMQPNNTESRALY